MKRIPRCLITQEFKSEAIKIVTEQHLNVAAAGLQLDVAHKYIRSWIAGSERVELNVSLSATKLTTAALRNSRSKIRHNRQS